ncbi:MAG: cysteine--tRNA ligase [Caldilineaceae bacterium]|nr:cysteine--tRNA ligase [Caldilineaceae bacterium]
MRLYNSYSQEIEPFQPQHDSVSIYVCGITPYDTTHLGHAFTYVMADVLIRYLEFLGHPVRYAQNVTDIDDDILRKAAEVGEDWRTLGNRWTRHFIEDMQQLNVRPPDFYPRASSVIPQIVAGVQTLADQGLAYVANGSAYYAVDAWPSFGALSKLSDDEQLETANERGNRPDDPNKHDPLDFVLWQAQAPGEPAWPSPWGAGRPGWHIECSTLVAHYLGDTIDLHGGGSDLIFPHHECEIAQSEPITGERPFVRHWFHTAMVRYQGEKMSKSLGNLVMVRDLLQDFSPDALRLYLAEYPYRQPWSYEEAGLFRAGGLAAKLNAAATALGGARAPAVDSAGCVQTFQNALDDDLNTPAALGALADLAESISRGAAAGRSIIQAQEDLQRMASVFGLRLHEGPPEDRVQTGWAAHLAEFEDGGNPGPT